MALYEGRVVEPASSYESSLSVTQYDVMMTTLLRRTNLASGTGTSADRTRATHPGKKAKPMWFSPLTRANMPAIHRPSSVATSS